jgi:serine/threonine-protein kinase
MRENAYLKMHKICPECNNVYEIKEKICPKCKTILIVLTDSDPLIGTTIDDRFMIIEPLGKGGMGSVYRAKQLTIDREVALKILRKDVVKDLTTIKRFLREAKATSKLNHINIITIHDFAQTDDGILYIAMELLEGSSLRNLLTEKKTIPYRNAINIAVQICSALIEAHSKDIIHRDLKPDNVIIIKKFDNPELVKVLDFGIAKILSPNITDKLTRSDQVFGTPFYMSPEQILGHELDPRSDIYSLGVMMYEMLTGTMPFFSETPAQLFMRITHDDPVPLSKQNPNLRIPESLETLIMKMMEKSPDFRPQSAIVLREELLSIAEIKDHDHAQVRSVPKEIVTAEQFAGQEEKKYEKLQQKTETAKDIFSLEDTQAVSGIAPDAKLPEKELKEVKDKVQEAEIFSETRSSPRKKLGWKFYAGISALSVIIIAAAVFFAMNLFYEGSDNIQVPTVSGYFKKDVIEAKEIEIFSRIQEKTTEKTVPEIPKPVSQEKMPVVEESKKEDKKIQVEEIKKDVSAVNEDLTKAKEADVKKSEEQKKEISEVNAELDKYKAEDKKKVKKINQDRTEEKIDSSVKKKKKPKSSDAGFIF